MGLGRSVGSNEYVGIAVGVDDGSGDGKPLGSGVGRELRDVDSNQKRVVLFDVRVPPW